jgi:hypothetical protein
MAQPGPPELILAEHDRRGRDMHLGLAFPSGYGADVVLKPHSLAMKI